MSSDGRNELLDSQLSVVDSSVISPRLYAWCAVRGDILRELPHEISDLRRCQGRGTGNGVWDSKWSLRWWVHSQVPEKRQYRCYRVDGTVDKVWNFGWRPVVGDECVESSLRISMRSGWDCDDDGAADVATVGERLLGTTVFRDNGEYVVLSGSPTHGRGDKVSVTGELQKVCPACPDRVPINVDVGGETGGKV